MRYCVDIRKRRVFIASITEGHCTIKVVLPHTRSVACFMLVSGGDKFDWTGLFCVGTDTAGLLCICVLEYSGALYYSPMPNIEVVHMIAACDEVRSHLLHIQECQSLADSGGMVHIELRLVTRNLKLNNSHPNFMALSEGRLLAGSALGAQCRQYVVDRYLNSSLCRRKERAYEHPQRSCSAFL